jgi:TniQ
MPTDGIVPYETWDMATPQVPPRSRFFNLEPVGLGTGLVESLTSYFSRLAQAHSVSPGALHHHEVMKQGAGRRNMFTCGINFRARCFTSGINSIGGVAADFVSALSTLTSRSDLAYLTMIPWKTLFPPQMLRRGVAAWCPVCLTSWEKAGKAVYVPLLWALEVVKFCPYHRCQLQLTCPHCGLPQPLIGQCSWVGFYTRCKRWLGLDSGKDDSQRYSVVQQETSDWEIWVANQMTELIETGFRNPLLLTRHQLSRVVRIGADLEGLSGFARILGVSSTAVNEWRMGEKQPVLPA